MSELPCPGCEGESISPDCGLCGGSGWLPDATPVVRRFLAHTHTLDLDSPETVERLATLIDRETNRLMNDRSSVGLHDDIRPYIRLRNRILAALREQDTPPAAPLDDGMYQCEDEFCVKSHWHREAQP